MIEDQLSGIYIYIVGPRPSDINRKIDNFNPHVNPERNQRGFFSDYYLFSRDYDDLPYGKSVFKHLSISYSICNRIYNRNDAIGYS
jgi:hypothetical protein